MRDLTPRQLAESAIDLFLEYRDRPGYQESEARERAITEVVEGTAIDLDQLRQDLAQGGAEHEGMISSPAGYPSWLATCSCGWGGPHRPNYEQASEDQREHFRDALPSQ